MEVWLKADRDDCAPVVFSATPDESVMTKAIRRHELQPTREWKRYEIRFTGMENIPPTTIALKAVGPSTISLDNLRLYAADAPFLDYRPYQYEQLRDSGMYALREHSAAVTRTATYSMRQYLGYPGLRRYQGHMHYGSTLSSFLRVCEKAGMVPWQKVEFHMSPEEWLAMVEYLAAPYDPKKDTPENKPYAYMRYQQGRKQPWADAFDRIVFELSNETWNRMCFPWAFIDRMTDAATGKRYSIGTVYALWHDYVADIMRSSPYWSQALEDKYIHMLGGWSGNLFNAQSLDRGFTQAIVHNTQSGELITTAPYNGGWEMGERISTEDNYGLFSLLANVYQFQAPLAKQFNNLLELGEKRLGRPLMAGIYEAGPSYRFMKTTKEEAEVEERVMKSKLSGTATIDAILTRMRYRSKIDGYFTFGEGKRWKSHAKRCYGGQPHAWYLPLQLFNNHTTGDMLLVETESTPTCDNPKPEKGKRTAVIGAPLTSAYAMQEGDRVALYCISRKVAGYPDPKNDGYTPFTVELPFTKAKKVTLYRLTGKPTDHNIKAYNVKIEDIAIDPSTLSANGSFTVNEATCGDARGLPPSEMYLYVFEGTDIGPEGRVLTRKEVSQQPYAFVPTEEQ